MKILMSAFACAPNVGSEPGVGWNWAIEAARLRHEVVVLTQREHEKEIRSAQARGLVPAGVSFDFFMPAWVQRLYDLGLKTGFHGITRQIIHLLWQIAAYFHVRAHHREQGYDVIHHITYGGIRHPTLLGRLGIPLVLGPLGGGDRAPFALRKSFSWGGWLTDLARDAHTFALRFDPITLSACRDALAIYTKTPKTREALPQRFHGKTKIHMDIGVHESGAAPPKRRVHVPPLKLIYAGRMLYLKGMALAFRALAEARARGADVRLTMVGSGPEEAAWRCLANELDIGQAVTWRGRVPHTEMDQLYLDHDALLFPSLRDSSGNVVLEALNNGLPVICLALGGPGQSVNAACGRVVPTAGRSELQCVAGLAEAIAELEASPETLDQLSRGARERAEDFRWSTVVGDLYRDVERRLAVRRVPVEAYKDAALQAGGQRR